jgi:hypothetical protein
MPHPGQNDSGPLSLPGQNENGLPAHRDRNALSHFTHQAVI